jgi:hypothetical protein
MLHQYFAVTGVLLALGLLSLFFVGILSAAGVAFPVVRGI